MPQLIITTYPFLLFLNEAYEFEEMKLKLNLIYFHIQ